MELLQSPYNNLFNFLAQYKVISSGASPTPFTHVSIGPPYAKFNIPDGNLDQFYDLYGKQGRYTPAMGPNMKQHPCPVCGTSIEKVSVGGGHIHLCPKCQI